MQYLEKRNFNNALQHISAFSKQSKKEIEISKVATSGSFWGFTNHNVTGSELNEVTSEREQHPQPGPGDNTSQFQGYKDKTQYRTDSHFHHHLYII